MYNIYTCMYVCVYVYMYIYSLHYVTLCVCVCVYMCVFNEVSLTLLKLVLHRTDQNHWKCENMSLVHPRVIC